MPRSPRAQPHSELCCVLLHPPSSFPNPQNSFYEPRAAAIIPSRCPISNPSAAQLPSEAPCPSMSAQKTSHVLAGLLQNHARVGHCIPAVYGFWLLPLRSSFSLGRSCRQRSSGNPAWPRPLGSNALAGLTAPVRRSGERASPAIAPSFRRHSPPACAPCFQCSS